MEKQYYIYDENFMFLKTNMYREQPENSVDFYPTVEVEFAKVDLINNVWIDTRDE